MASKPGWGTAVGWIFSILPSKEESRRNKYAKLKKKREKIFKKADTEANRRKLVDIDRRMLVIERKAINQ